MFIMKKGSVSIFILIAIMLVTSVFLLSYLFSDVSSDVRSAEQRQCENIGGTWKEFGNTCVDLCEFNRNPNEIVCGQALTFGCSCGEGMCWDGDDCVGI